LKQLTPEQATKVAAILTKYKVDLSTVGTHNPWDSNSERAESFRQFIQHESPELAAELSQHKAPSLAYMALEQEIKSGADIDVSKLPPAVLREWEERNPALAKQLQAQMLSRIENKMAEDYETACKRRQTQRKYDEASWNREKQTANSENQRWISAMAGRMNRPARDLIK